jgi:hypothetical protein
MGTEENVSLVSTHGIAAMRSLSALLSQVLIAFTVEFDNEFERRMGVAGYPGARLSLVVWANLMRFVGEGGISVCDLARKALARDNQIKFELGCLERWGFVVLQPDPSSVPSVPSGTQRQSGRELRAGWGSGRGIRRDWMVRLTSKSHTAGEIWPPLFGEIEGRWEKRFGKNEISRLRQSLQHIVDKLDVELPHGLPAAWLGTDDFPARIKRASESLPLPTLLSQLLLTFGLEFDRESPVPLVHCANTLRVLGEKPTRVAEVPRLTGGSPEATDIGWQIKPYVVVTSDPTASRGKVARLSPRGLRAQQHYQRLIWEIEKRWEERFGKDTIRTLRASLQELFDQHSGGAPLISEGLVPPRGTVRAGEQAPALGRRDVGSAAWQRMRNLVAQTEAFVHDPAGRLPHYPSWDMNRGFGP